MKAFINFFGGTTGVILAITICSFCSLLATIVFCVLSGGTIIAIAGTPTP